MNLLIEDIDPESIYNEHYDIGIFASGYEARCIYAAKVYEDVIIRHTLVLGFDALANNDQRKENDKYYFGRKVDETIILSADSDIPIYRKLSALFSHSKSEIRILVDYSSMSRLWYAAILNWARFMPSVSRIQIDFVYSVGLFEGELPFYSIQDILPIPGTEGGALRFGDSVAILGLGLFGLMAECVIEQLQPSVVYAFLASPGPFPEYASAVKKNNQPVIDHASLLLEIPLGSVVTAVRYLTELILPHRADSEILIIPMGPKPHVLAAMLLAIKYREVACLRVSAKRQWPERVTPSGDLLVTRVLARNGTQR